MARKPTVSIVGAGRVGGAIGLALARAGYAIAAAWSHSRGGRRRAHELLDCPVLDAAETAAAGNVVVLSVPDDAIEDMTNEIAPAVREGQTIFHTSGGTPVAVLGSLREAGARTGSVHPLQTVPDARHGADQLRGAAVAITADADTRPPLQRLARAWGGRPFVLAEEDKRIYHAAAVFASNYVVSSVWAAVQLFETIGLRHANELLRPLVEASLENVLARGGARAITGPVARGDVNVVRRHVNALEEIDPTGGAITDADRALARMTASFAGADVAAVKKATA